jgi:hypothetical protein
MAKPEEQLHVQLCEYVKVQYPDVIFFSEPSGLRLQSWHQRKLLKKIRSVGKLPDLFLAFPVSGLDAKGNVLSYHGFFLELKVEGTTIYKKDGKVVADEHIQAQLQTLIRLFKLGYGASFGIGFNQSKKLIDDYMAIAKSVKQKKTT